MSDDIPSGFKRLTDALDEICMPRELYLTDLGVKSDVERLMKRFEWAADKQVLGRKNGAGPRVPIHFRKRKAICCPLFRALGISVCAGTEDLKKHPDVKEEDLEFQDVVLEMKEAKS